MSKNQNPMKVVTGPDTRWSYVNAWEPKSINGGAPKYSVSLIIPTSPRLHGNTGGQFFTGKCGGLCFQWIAHRITHRSQGIQTFASLGTCANDIFISLIKPLMLN